MASTIGIVGGMSPESTVTYYQHIVRSHRERQHNHQYPRMVIVSVPFQDYVDWQHAGDWDRIAEGIEFEIEAAIGAGAAIVAIASNTMHKVLPHVKSNVPVLSILDAVARHGQHLGITTLGLTGTRFTMADGFYARGLEDRGFRLVLPTTGEQNTIHTIIYDELIAGRVSTAAIKQFGSIASALLTRGAEAVLLACTELELLTRSGQIGAPTLDTTRIHAEALWEASLKLRTATVPSSEP